MPTVDELIKEFNESGKEILESYPNGVLPTTPRYHYTNFNGLKGILEERRLWFTDYNYLNDTTEIIFANNVIKKKINNFSQKSKQKEFWQEFNNKFPDKTGLSSIYISCFCESRDYLPAWRWYGDNGSGFSIGFSSKYFEWIDKETQNKSQVVNLRVNYDIAEYFELIERFLKLTEKCLSRIPQGTIALEKLSGTLAAHLLPLLPGLKHEGFKYEKEHRLYRLEVKNHKGEAIPGEIPGKFSKSTSILTCLNPCNKIENNPCKQPSNQAIIPTSKSEQFHHEEIIEIWVGPCCDYECAKEEIKKILDNTGYDKSKIEIKKSNLPYRS